MPKFVFPLQGLLRQRKHVEQQRQRELAEKQAVVTALEGELRSLEQTVSTAVEDVRKNRLVGTIDLHFLAAHRRFMLGMQRRAMELAQKIAAARKQADEARQLLSEAAKARKVVEKLRERQFERWRAGIAKKELEELDEVGMQISYRNLVESMGQGDAERQSG